MSDRDYNKLWVKYKKYSPHKCHHYKKDKKIQKEIQILLEGFKKYKAMVKRYQ